MRDTLFRAIARGVRQVQYAAGMVTYNTFDDMNKALEMLDDEIAKAQGATPKGRTSFATFSRG